MTKRMLIDAAHPEETRVVVLDGTRLIEFDYETSTKKQIKGNIYLAKVTRVEPSLQAAFVEYGGNRHGFLAFNEIHPDYYRIPVADRAADGAARIPRRRSRADRRAGFPCLIRGFFCRARGGSRARNRTCRHPVRRRGAGRGRGSSRRVPRDRARDRRRYLEQRRRRRHAAVPAADPRRDGRRRRDGGDTPPGAAAAAAL